MGAQLRELRARVKATKSIGKITKAMELIATSRIAKAQARVEAARPYSSEITTALSELATAATTLDNPLLTERENPRRAAVLVVTSDKGLCGGYNADRKSTRLNSSHVKISYAVFCLKKKKLKTNTTREHLHN